jgi:tetratricopeptide (TPR) repeat protein
MLNTEEFNGIKGKILIEFRNKEYESCIKTCNSLSELCGDNWVSFYNIARCLRQLGNYKDAIHYANLALAQVKDRIEEHITYWLIGLCYRNLGETETALKYYLKCKEYYTEINALMNLADIYYNIGFLLNDIEYILQAIELYKKEDHKYIIDDETYKDMFEIYLKNNNLLKAQLILKKIKSISLKQQLMSKMCL